MPKLHLLPCHSLKLLRGIRLRHHPRRKHVLAISLAAAGLASPEVDSDSDDEAVSSAGAPTTPAELVDREWTFCLEKIAQKDKRFKKSDFNDARLLQWWDTQVDRMPCLRMVVKSLHGMLPGSGGLELDIGGFKDVIGPKRAQLDPGLVEVQLMLNVNKDLTTLDTLKIPKLGVGWRTHIPTRPKFPDDYFDEVEEEEQTTDPTAEQPTGAQVPEELQESDNEIEHD